MIGLFSLRIRGPQDTEFWGRTSEREEAKASELEGEKKVHLV